MLVIVSSDFIN